jgi:hypothetical protein
MPVDFAIFHPSDPLPIHRSSQNVGALEVITFLVGGGIGSPVWGFLLLRACF